MSSSLRSPEAAESATRASRSSVRGVTLELGRPDRNSCLTRERCARVHVAEIEMRAVAAVEDLEHADRSSVIGQWDGEDGARNADGPPLQCGDRSADPQ